MEEIIKIAIMGPESTGKSSISAALANAYQTVWVPEFARNYCAGLDHFPSLDDERNMLLGQNRLEDEGISAAHRLLFCDTMFLTVKIWSEYVYQTYPQELDASIRNRIYDLFLIMDVDLPWQDDPLREFPNLREYFLSKHVSEIKALSRPFAIVSGQGEKRMDNAVNAIERFLSLRAKRLL